MERVEKMGSFKKWKTLALFVLALGFSLTSWSQAAVPEAEADSWAKAYHADGLSSEYAYSSQQTSDGGYIMAGSGGWDILVVKLNQDNTPQWTKTLNLDVGWSDLAYSVRQTDDDGYVIAGHNLKGLLIVKLDQDGNKLWAKAFGGNNDHAYSVQQTTDGGYIVAGGTRNFGTGGKADLLVVKLDGDGNRVWAKAFGTVGAGQEAFSVQQTSNGGYIIAGDAYPADPGTGIPGVGFAPAGEFLILRLDQNGNQIWSKTFGGVGYNDIAFSVQQTSEGGYIAAGYTGYNWENWDLGNKNFLVLKLDENGGKVWARAFGDRNINYGRSIQQTSDGGYIMGGYGNGGKFLRLDGNGNKVWAKNFSGGSYIRSVQQTSDGGYFAGGHNTNGLFGIKIDQDGSMDKCDSLWSDWAIVATPDIAQTTSDFALITTNIFSSTSDTALTITSLGSTETDICPILDLTPPALATEAWIPDDGGTFVDDGDVVNLDDIDEVGEFVTVYSDASDDSGIQDHKIKWWKNGVPQFAGSWFTGGTHSATIPGPLADGDLIEYTSEATDNAAPPNTAYDPASGRYSFTVVETKTWARVYEGAQTYANYIQQTSDGGYIVAGVRINAVFRYDFFLMKIDSSGSPVWERTLDGGGSDSSYSVQKVSDGYVVAGNSTSYAPTNATEFLIAKLDLNGNKDWDFDGGAAWAKTFDRGGSVRNNARAILKVSDGYVVSGASDGNFSILKLNFNGDQQWAKSYGEGKALQHSIDQTDDGGYILVYHSGAYSASPFDGVVMKISSGGAVEWTKVFGGDSWDLLESVKRTSDGGYIAVGSTRNFAADSNDDIFVLKLLSNGNLDWAKTYYNEDKWWGDLSEEKAFSVQEDPSGGYMVVGNIERTDGFSSHPLILKLDSDGNKEWAKILMDIIAVPDDVIQVQKTADGGYVASGSTLNGRAFVFKFDSDGNIPGCDVVAPDPPILSLDVTALALKSSPDIIPVNIAFNEASVDPAVTPLDLTETDVCIPLIPPTCSISTPATAEVGIVFDIDVNGSADPDGDINNAQVRFLSDDNQDNNPAGTWTGWFDWDTSGGDWDAVAKKMSWSFAAAGNKEVWMEIKDESLLTCQNHSDMDALAGNAAPTALFDAVAN